MTLPPAEYYASLPKHIAGAGAILHDPEGRILLVRPSYRDDTWEIPGGAMNVGEYPWETAQRETKEELGLDLPPGRLLVVDWVPPQPDGRPALANFVFDGGQITQAEAEKLHLQADELADWRLTGPTEWERLLALHMARRIAACAEALSTGTTLYLQHGRRLSDTAETSKDTPGVDAQRGPLLVGPATGWLLVGLTGSGKTTFAKRLEQQGVVRLSVDEEVFRRHGRYGVDFHESRWFELAGPAAEEVYRRLGELVRSGRDVVLDHGLWTREDRDAAKKLVEEAGGRWRLIYFKVGRDELMRRLQARNQRADANALLVTESALEDFIARFDGPDGEGEEIFDAQQP
ncbi:AAA family ATPase [Actinomadura violacea]|uniref:AAA family ATPase n=1 Tax=Actinomadura violacea TaxID=2819934 RepID=A0ABS3S7H8_9ACTN|nr:AAA family ATPase [Actinomadura violacea]MBO2464945.1 AAA family ATPase [Actinomadura violacea]